MSVIAASNLRRLGEFDAPIILILIRAAAAADG